MVLLESRLRDERASRYDTAPFDPLSVVRVDGAKVIIRFPSRCIPLSYEVLRKGSGGGA